MTIDEKFDKNGNLIGWKIRVCVGREDGKQKWKTMLLKANDPVFDELKKYKRKDTILEKRETIINRIANEFEDTQKEEFNSQQEAKAKDPNAVIIDKRKITLSQYVHTYWWKDVLASKPRPNTLAFYKYTSENICSYFDGLPNDKQKLCKIEARTVKDFINYLKAEAVGKNGQPLSGTTVLRHWQTFRNIIGSALRDDYIEKDPCIKFKSTDKPTTPRFDGGFLTKQKAQEFIKLLDATHTDKDGKEVYNIDLQWRCLINILLQHGLRRGEVIGLRWCDLKSETIDGKEYHTMTICHSITPDASAEDKVHVDDPKTVGSLRTILIQPEIHTMLSDLKAKREKDYGIDILPTSEIYVFCKSDDPNSPMYPTSPTKWLSRFVEDNQLPNVSPHDLRRTWATLANDAGVNQKVMQYNLGHSGGADTESKHYIKVTAEGQIQALETMHTVFYGKKPKKANEAENTVSENGA